MNHVFHAIVHDLLHYIRRWEYDFKVEPRSRAYDFRKGARATVIFKNPLPVNNNKKTIKVIVGYNINYKDYFGF